MTSTCPEAAFPTFCKLRFVCGWIILCWGSCAGTCEMFGPNPWSLPLGARSTLHIVTMKVCPAITRGPTQTPGRGTAALTPGRKNPSSTAAARGRGFSHKPMRSPLQESPVISSGCGALKEQHSLSQRMPLSSVGGKHSLPSRV